MLQLFGIEVKYIEVILCIDADESVCAEVQTSDR